MEVIPKNLYENNLVYFQLYRQALLYKKKNPSESSLDNIKGKFEDFSKIAEVKIKYVFNGDPRPIETSLLLEKKWVSDEEFYDKLDSEAVEKLEKISA